MRIKSIEYENFRNFKERGKIECSTDQKVTIIYGRNGDGKTTLHQLFQWIFYGEVHFNKTATDKLYNLEFEQEAAPGSAFEVMGRINFIHGNNEYTLRRTAYYEKDILGITKLQHEEMELQKRDDDHNWKSITTPVETIERILPSGLSDYFFFDGENMIADLSTKSNDSANKLKKALYSIFDLDVLNLAIDHVGDTDSNLTVIGKIYMSRGNPGDNNESELNKVKTLIDNVQGRIEQFSKKNERYIAERDEKRQLIQTVSEQIGSTKSKAEYEKTRKDFQKERDRAQKTVEQLQNAFGDLVIETFPKLLISKAVLDASDILKLKINMSKLPFGLDKPLINYLLSKDNEAGICICGNPLCESERNHIEAYLNMLPPKSYTNIYQDFIARAKSWGTGHNTDSLENYIQLVIDNNETIDEKEEAIRQLDSVQKRSPDIESLVEARINAEQRVRELDDKIQHVGEELKKAQIYLRKQKNDYEKLIKDDAKDQEAKHKIKIMEAVRQHFVDRLHYSAHSYSRKLQDNIQQLLDSMMDNERKVVVSDNFAVKVVDNFGDESKSEGQFAITSFAYIGGILKMLQNEEGLVEKEFPLVLDGPFSKLDPEKIQNVVNTIPKFAPQVILFSKDSLQEIFSPEQIGRVWTIKSNVEQNVAVIKEGFLWN